mgnify:CR=1 FL=1|jgi:hypothetical protein
MDVNYKMDVIIYVTKDKNVNIMKKYCKDFEDLGFVYENKIELESLDYTIARYSYHKNDFSKDISQILNLDDKINLEENHTHYIINDK